MRGVVMSGEAERVLSRLGRAVALVLPEETRTIKAVIQPLRYKNKIYLGGSFLPPGRIDGGHYLYLGPCSERLEKLPFGTYLRAQDGEYAIKRSDTVYVGETPAYVWAILQKRTASHTEVEK